MPDISIGRSGSAQTAIVLLANLSTAVLLGSVLAYWTWQWLAPRPEARVQSAIDVTATGAAQGLFGTALGGSAVTGSTAGTFSLLGVAAAAEGRVGHAVVRLGSGKTVAASEGEDLSPGVRLLEVHVDHVILERNGVRETLAWPRKGIR